MPVTSFCYSHIKPALIYGNRVLLLARLPQTRLDAPLFARASLSCAALFTIPAHDLKKIPVLAISSRAYLHRRVNYIHLMAKHGYSRPCPVECILSVSMLSHQMSNPTQTKMYYARTQTN
jgi:hypothetical protein